MEMMEGLDSPATPFTAGLLGLGARVLDNVQNADCRWRGATSLYHLSFTLPKLEPSYKKARSLHTVMDGCRVKLGVSGLCGIHLSHEGNNKEFCFFSTA